MIYYQDGVKKMRPVLSREQYLSLRGSEQQKAILKAVRERPRVGDQGSGMGNDQQKQRLIQMNYSCLPNEDGSLKGSNVSRNTVRQMLKNWKKQGLIVQTEAGRYRKMQEVCH